MGEDMWVEYEEESDTDEDDDDGSSDEEDEEDSEGGDFLALPLDDMTLGRPRK